MKLFDGDVPSYLTCSEHPELFRLKVADIDALEARAKHMVREARVEELESTIKWCNGNRCKDVKQGKDCEGDEHDHGYCQAMSYTEAVCKDRIKTLNTPTGKEVSKEGGDA